ncbi:MAG: family 20 glycosylhydrolase [Planctomycetes bacterium]|nr:family 20 glycosylhydrolase [Planctomycetota bacterium]
MRLHSFVALTVSCAPIIASLQAHAEDTAFASLIPQPRSCSAGEGFCGLPSPVPFNLPADGRLSEETIRLTVGHRLVLAAQPSEMPPAGGLRLLIGDPRAQGQSLEAYRLIAGQSGIEITGRTGEGVLNGLRTLAQLAIDGPIPCCEIVDWPDASLRGTHLCYHLVRETLAYNTPSFDALMELIDRMASVKINAVLLELEAMFPYRRHAKITCDIAFTREQIERLRRCCELHHIEIIPMVQCLGHAYSVLTREEYAEYRELPDHIQQYCPTNPKVADLYMEFVDEYLQAFPGLRQWHVGGDESRMLGRCPRCEEKVGRLGVARLYGDHVGEIARRVAAKGLKPLLWSDMLEAHPEAVDQLPKDVKIVYWNYHLATWPRPYAAATFMKKGFEVLCANAVRSLALGTELSVYYPLALEGIESLTRRALSDGCREIITTNWMKGSPHESTQYGLVYAAALDWNQSTSLTEFQDRYARLTFGLADPRICALYERLSLRLPYAEPVQNHMVNRLDRFNLSGLRFPEKWGRYTKPDAEPAARDQLSKGFRAASDVLAQLDQIQPSCIRGRREVEMLRLSAECIRAKARLGLALHEGRQIEAAGANEQILRWCAELPATVGQWRAAKERHHRVLLQTGFKPCIDFLNELMFEPAELEFLQQMGDRLAGKIAEGKGPAQVAVAFLDNPGPPYQRGFVHGRTFRSQIHEDVDFWCRQRINTAGERVLSAKRQMFSHVLEHYPCIIQELQGIADGAGKSLDEIFWLNIFNAVSRVQAGEACSAVIRRDAAGALHLGKTTDSDDEQRKVTLLRRVRDQGRDFYVLGWVGTVWVEVALTRSGLAIGANSAPAQPGQSASGIPQHFGAYPVLFEADNVDQAIAAFQKIRFAGKGLVFGLADAAGNAAVLEKTGTAQGVIRLHPDQPGVIGVNDYRSAAMQAHNAGVDEARRRNCQDRRDAFERWLSSTGGPDAIAQLLSEPPLCQAGQIGLHTVDAAILSPAAGEFRLTGLPPSAKQYATWRFADGD